MGLESMDMIRLKISHQDENLYMPVNVEFLDSRNRIYTYVALDNPKRILTCTAEKTFDICLNRDEIQISKEETAHVIGTPLIKKNSPKMLTYYDLPPGPLCDAVQDTVDKLDDTLNKILPDPGINDNNLAKIEKYANEGYIIGYSPRINDATQIRVYLPTIYAKHGNQFRSQSKIQVPVDIYAIKALDKKFFDNP